jgi:hypothetical protein
VIHRRGRKIHVHRKKRSRRRRLLVLKSIARGLFALVCPYLYSTAMIPLLLLKALSHQTRSMLDCPDHTFDDGHIGQRRWIVKTLQRCGKVGIPGQDMKEMGWGKRGESNRGHKFLDKNKKS